MFIFIGEMFFSRELQYSERIGLYFGYNVHG